MQVNYQYQLVAPIGQGFAPEFTPVFSPKQMLEMGVFEGKYCNDCRSEFPSSWFENAKISALPVGEVRALPNRIFGLNDVLSVTLKTLGGDPQTGGAFL